MKIAVVSRSDEHKAEIAEYLRTRRPVHDLTTYAEIPSPLLSGADRAPPDVLIIDGPEKTELERAERLAYNYPSLSCIVLSNNTTPEFLLAAMRAGARELLRLPLDGDALVTALERVATKRNGTPRPGGQVLAFISCKGGSGATFIASNLGYALAKMGKRVALVDLNLQFGDASQFVTEQSPQATIGDIARQIHRLDASLLASSMLEATPGYRILAAPQTVIQADEIKPEHLDKLLKLLREQSDFVLLDVCRHLDPVGVHALDRADVVYPVLQSSLAQIRSARRMLKLFDALGYRKDKIKLLVNRYEKNRGIRIEDLEATLRMTATTLPNHYEAASASENQGVPVVKLARSSVVARGLQEMAESLVGEGAQAPGGWLRRVLLRA